MSEIAFASLLQLFLVDLTWNRCIAESFEIESGSINFRGKLSRNCASAEAKKKELSCGASIACDERQGALFCCELEYGTFIDAPDYTFAADTDHKTITKLLIEHQQKIKFLPISLHERFSNFERILRHEHPGSKNIEEKL